MSRAGPRGNRCLLRGRRSTCTSTGKHHRGRPAATSGAGGVPQPTEPDAAASCSAKVSADRGSRSGRIRRRRRETKHSLRTKERRLRCRRRSSFQVQLCLDLGFAVTIFQRHKHRHGSPPHRVSVSARLGLRKVGCGQSREYTAAATRGPCARIRGYGYPRGSSSSRPEGRSATGPGGLGTRPLASGRSVVGALMLAHWRCTGRRSREEISPRRDVASRSRSCWVGAYRIERPRRWTRAREYRAVVARTRRRARRLRSRRGLVGPGQYVSDLPEGTAASPFLGI